MLSQLGAEGVKYVLCDYTGRGLLEACAGFLWTVPLPFPFADLALYSFTVINHSCEYSCVPSPVDFLSKSLTEK